MRSLVLDNYIDKVVVLLKDEVKERRRQLLEERKGSVIISRSVIQSNISFSLQMANSSYFKYDCWYINKRFEWHYRQAKMQIFRTLPTLFFSAEQEQYDREKESGRQQNAAPPRIRPNADGAFPLRHYLTQVSFSFRFRFSLVFPKLARVKFRNVIN